MLFMRARSKISTVGRNCGHQTLCGSAPSCASKIIFRWVDGGLHPGSRLCPDDRRPLKFSAVHGRALCSARLREGSGRTGGPGSGDDVVPSPMDEELGRPPSRGFAAVEFRFIGGAIRGHRSVRAESPPSSPAPARPRRIGRRRPLDRRSTRRAGARAYAGKGVAIADAKLPAQRSIAADYGQGGGPGSLHSCLLTGSTNRQGFSGVAAYGRADINPLPRARFVLAVVGLGPRMGPAWNSEGKRRSSRRSWPEIGFQRREYCATTAWSISGRAAGRAGMLTLGRIIRAVWTHPHFLAP